MKHCLSFFFVLCICYLNAQENPDPLPRFLTESEKELLRSGEYSIPNNMDKALSDPPSFPTRSIGEWEELQSIIVTWDAYYPVLRDIVKYAKEEVKVINICQDSQSIKSYLSSNGLDLNNLQFIEAPFNTVWVRDYGPNSVYMNDVDSLVLIDWIYNRPRPADDIISDVIAEYLNVPVYSSTTAPNDLVHTGGNYMADGLGTGFSSQLILEENDQTNNFGTSNHTEEDIENIMFDFMGIEEYPKMSSLLYDGINHIDMHMKLLDEQTILIGEFPQNISDGPRIEDNIQFIQDNYKTKWGTDFKIERIVQPPCANGNYPPNCQGGNFSAEYRTYTNALFVNKTILVPIYNTSTDEIALNRWEELMPGYKIYGIDCRQIINAGGAIHCVTKEIGVDDPLLIAHREMDDIRVEENTEDYLIEALIKHRSGIKSADLYWSTDMGLNYQKTPMDLANQAQALWNAYIPNQLNGSHILYYIEAQANSGKTILRPLPAPQAYFEFSVEELDTGIHEIDNSAFRLTKVYPNPGRSTSYIEVQSSNNEELRLSIVNALGNMNSVIYQGKTEAGINAIPFDTSSLPKGTYWIELRSRKLDPNQYLKFIKF